MAISWLQVAFAFVGLMCGFVAYRLHRSYG